MKRIGFITAMLWVAIAMQAQVLKIENGLSFSSMQDDTPMHQFVHNATGYTGRIGVDWLQHKWFYLSSEVGYMATGGVDHVFMSDGAGIDTGILKWHLRRDNVHINTTFRAQWVRNNFHAYVGIGPKVDIPVNISSDGDTQSNLFKKDIMLGVKAEIGAAYDINSLRLGLNVAYLPDITRQVSYLNTTTRNNIFSVGISIGYIL